MHLRLSALTMGLGLSLFTTAVQAAPKKLQLKLLDALPAGETLAVEHADPLLLGASDDASVSKQKVELGKRPLELSMDETGADGSSVFLVARANGKKVWSIDQYPSAGGSEVSIAGKPTRRIAFMAQSRIGVWPLDLATGKVLSGFTAPVVSPDGSWAILQPYFSGFVNCLESARPARVRLDGALALKTVAATPAPKAVMCSDEHEVEAFVQTAAAISEAGDLYAVALTATDADPNSENAKITIDIFDAKSDKRLATFVTPQAPLDGLHFTKDGRFLVVSGAPGNDGKLTPSVVLAITR